MGTKLIKEQIPKFQIWKSRVTLVDLDTGEELSENLLINYDFINKEKKVDYEQRVINWTKCYRRSKTHP